MRGLLQFQLHFDALLRENEGEQSKEKLKKKNNDNNKQFKMPMFDQSLQEQASNQC